MSNPRRTKASKSHMQKIQSNMTKVSRHPNNRHHHPNKLSSLPKSRIIHINIRSKSNNLPKENAHHQERSINKNQTKRSKDSDDSDIINKIHSTPYESHLTNTQTISKSPDIFTVSDEYIRENHTDRKGVTNDYHRIHKKKKNTRSCIISSVVASLILAIAIMAILLGLFIKPKSNEKSVNPCISRVLWDNIGITYAGNGTHGSSLNQLETPNGIFIDSTNSLYINDAGNFRSLKYLPDATTGILIAGGTQGTALNQFSLTIQFNYVDSNQSIYVADTSNHRVMRWANGASAGVRVAGDGTFGYNLNQVRDPRGLWVDSNFNLYVAEYQAHRVTKWAPGATVGVVVAGGNGQGKNELEISHKSFTYSLIGSTPDKLSNPSGLVYDEENQDFYITNAVSNTVIKWHNNALNGTFVAGISGTSGSSAILLSNPIDLKLDQWKNIYVLDNGNSRVQLFCNGDKTGITIVGNGSVSSNLQSPHSIALDSQLNLYVSENTGARITKFVKL
ncbi:unnamed protein product [Adineta ricciae]|uniref:Uncharacterized protein n=1 Tax=Adineta ricciae TaxID=249248 RepID=A0A814W3J4_ADIRI|nr:unnamed protein product [Adineta ricciae]